MSTVFQVDLPDDLTAALEAAGYTPERLSREALRYYSAVLFARKALTLEQAARFAEMPLWDYLPFLADQGVPIADYDEREVETELETARWLVRS